MQIAPTPVETAPLSPPGRSRLRPNAALALSLLFPVLGLAASAMLAVDYRHAAPVFCAETGCAAVRHSPLSSLFGIPMPLFGIAGFAAIGAASLAVGRTARAAQVGLASIGAVAGALLLFAQALLGHFCPYCGVADGSAIASAAVAVWRFVAGGAGRSASPEGAWGARPSIAGSVAGACLLVAAGVVPFVLGARASGVPAVIRAEQARTPKGDVTIVDFVDFECPFCRMTQAALEPLLKAHRDRIRLVRKQVPLRIHEHAHDAARAACCGQRLGKGDAMAAALFVAPVDELTPAGCEAIATRVGLSLDAYRACVADPKTDAQIDADRAEFKAAGGAALPTLWIGDREIIGALPPEALQAAIEEALRRAGG